jgi:glyoxylase-like metal-dependent hydrolase (beta-lactamase superfamily II)
LVTVDRYGPVTRFRMKRSILGLNPLYVHAFCVDGLLIDTGPAFGASDLAAAIEREGCRPEQLVNTHTHEDHIGANRILCERYGLTPQVHPLGLDPLAHPEPWHHFHLYRLAYWGAAQPGPPAVALGDELRTDKYRFHVIQTPGHAQDHVALWEPDQGWLFTGDLVLGAKLLRVRPTEEPLTAIRSLKLLAKLKVGQVFCSHNWRVWTDTSVIQAKIAHWEGLKREAHRLQAEGLSESGMMERLLGAGDPIEFVSHGDFHRRHLLRGLLRGAPPTTLPTRGGDPHLTP